MKGKAMESEGALKQEWPDGPSVVVLANLEVAFAEPWYASSSEGARGPTSYELKAPRVGAETNMTRIQQQAQCIIYYLT